MSPTHPSQDAWIVTASGDELQLTQPAPGHITAYTLAHAQAQINRFTGHAVRPYSVAEHALLVVEILELELGHSTATLDGTQALLAGLMHDAHEALCGDLHTPGKALVGPAWERFEGHLESCVRSAFALHTAARQHAADIKRADRLALATERAALLPPAPTPWPILQGMDPVPWAHLRSVERQLMTWEDWRDRWLDRYHELDFARNEHTAQSNTTPLEA